MKKQQKKAFTLVELLVVIAILAILASVAVVGYTAFIKNAAVSNDENVVAQMNRYLEALQADSTGEWYGKEIHAGNVKQLTAYILDESGLEKLEPAAAKYGYNFYFDLEAGEYVAKRNEEVYDSEVVTRNFFRGIYVSAEEGEATTSKYEKRLENCFTTNNQYFLVDTLSSLAELINSVYNIGTNEEGSAKSVSGAEINTLIESLSGTEIHSFVSTSVIVTEGKNYRPAGTETPSTVIIVNNVTFVNTHTQAKNDNGDWVDVDSVEKLADTNKLTLPDTVEAIENNALKLAENAEIYTEKTADELSGIANGSFTDANIKSEDGNTYKAGDDGITTTEDVKLCDYSYVYGLTKITIQDNDSVALNPTTANKNVVIPQENGDIAIKIPYEVNSFAIRLSLEDNREEGSTAPVLGQDTIVWSIDETTKSAVECKYSITNKTLTVTLKEDQSWPNNFTLTASSNGVVQSFVVDVEDITAGTVTFNGVDLVEGETPEITVITSSSENISYAIAKGDYTYTHGNLGVCDDTITATFSSDCAEVVYDEEGNCSLLAKANGSGTLTITVGSEAYTYLTYTVNLTIADTSNFAVQPKNNNNFTVLGSKNEIKVSDLFELKGDLPEGAKLVVYSGAVGENDSYMTPDRYVLYSTESGEVGVTVDKPEQVITTDGLSALSLQFAGADPAGTVRIAVVHNGVRISEDIEVSIVDAYNVTDFAQIRTLSNPVQISAGDWTEVSRESISLSAIADIVTGESVKSTKSNITTHPDTGIKTLSNKVVMEKTELKNVSSGWIPDYKLITYTKTCDYEYTISGCYGENLVLLNDVTMGQTYNLDSVYGALDLGSYNTLEIPAKTTFYGNGFKFTLANGRLTQEGIITLNGTIKDTKIVANVYNTFAFSAADDYGSSAIVARKGAVIENCYVSGARSPLRTTGDVTVKNSVFYGGIFANINITGGNLKIEGEVITINQTKSESSTEKVGMGIAFWWSTDADKSKVVMADGAKLTQYNFISEKDADNMAAASYSGIDAVDLGSIFTEVINSKDATYAQHIFERSGTKYCNTGISYIKEEKTDDSMFNHNSKYGTITYVYDPGALIGKVMEKVIGSKTLPVVINTLVSENHTENKAFFNSDITKNAATIFDPATYGFGADGQIITNGK